MRAFRRSVGMFELFSSSDLPLWVVTRGERQHFKDAESYQLPAPPRRSDGKQSGSPAHSALLLADSGSCLQSKRKWETEVDRSNTRDQANCPSCRRILTRNGSGEALWLAVEESLSQLRLPAAGWTNQCDRPLPIGRLVIQSHLLIGENFIVIEIWSDAEEIKHV